jgi:hypothetical protein
MFAGRFDRERESVFDTAPNLVMSTFTFAVKGKELRSGKRYTVPLVNGPETTDGGGETIVMLPVVETIAACVGDVVSVPIAVSSNPDISLYKPVPHLFLIDSLLLWFDLGLETPFKEW